jgi:hypothetical protein
MDLKRIGEAAAQSDSTQRPIDKNLVLQLDADFACYECANTDESVNQNIKNLKSRVRHLGALAGAGHINVHITLGMKGGRSEMATVKPYQENRAGVNDERKARVHLLREALANWATETITPVPSTLQEADDALAQHQIARIESHGVASSAIMSGDKDLWMVKGRHCDAKSGAYYEVSGFGKTEYREVGNLKPKLVGEGTSWFWHQMLMGDTADNIAGLPQLSGRLMDIYVPRKAKKPARKPAQCGEAKAVAVLKGLKTDALCARAVLACYQEHYGKALGMEMLVESAFLLWMRRTTSLRDCIVFLNASGLQCDFTARQLMRLRKYIHMAKIQQEQMQ